MENVTMRPFPLVALFISLAANIWFFVALLPSAIHQSPVERGEVSTHPNTVGKGTAYLGVVGGRIGGFIHANRDDINALSTIVVAVFTTVLGVFTVSLAKSTRIAANAAKNSADAAFLIELPIIELKQFLLISPRTLRDTEGPVLGHGLELPDLCGLVVNYLNSGRTGAEVLEQCVEWRVCEVLPPTPEYSHQTHFPPGQITKPGATTGTLKGNNFALNAAQQKNVAEGTQFLWVYCYLRYRDFLGHSHEKRFCAKWLGTHPFFRTPVGFVYNSNTPSAYIKSY